MDFYQLKPRMPGGFWLALVVMVIGMTLIIFSLTSTTSTPLSIVGCVIVLGGLILLTMTIIATLGQYVKVSFDDQGYAVESPRGEFSGSWLDVTDVSVSRKTAKIALWHGPNRRTIIAHPARTMDDEFMAIREGIRHYLDQYDSLTDGWDEPA
ncbi:MAG: hypothetical protein FWG08_06985 [Propionibacteriaceae bacterium]|nr:hypothetical protein [Propionibacteriaceae bacterium]